MRPAPPTRAARAHQPEPHPTPLIPARPATAAETPRNAGRVLAQAAALGWATSATYAHGTTFGAQGQPTRVVESLVLRLVGTARAVVGVWHDGKYDTGYVLARKGTPLRVGWRDLAAAVEDVTA